MVPSAIEIMVTPRQTPSLSKIKSRAKYSTKKVQLKASDFPKRVCNIACPVLSATAHVR